MTYIAINQKVARILIEIFYSIRLWYNFSISDHSFGCYYFNEFLLNSNNYE